MRIIIILLFLFVKTKFGAFLALTFISPPVQAEGKLYSVNNFRQLTNDSVVVQNVSMRTQEVPIASFLKEIMRRRKRLPSQLAADLGISHATVSR